MRKKLNDYGLCVSLDSDVRYYFYNKSYSMEFILMKKHIRDFIKKGETRYYHSDENGISSSNSIKTKDIIDIKSYLKNINKYKSISTCLRYSKQDKLKENLKAFDTLELYEYIVKKNKNKSIVLI